MGIDSIGNKFALLRDIFINSMSIVALSKAGSFEVDWTVFEAGCVSKIQKKIKR